MTQDALIAKALALPGEGRAKERAARGSEAKFRAVLAKAPNANPVVGDELPKAPRKSRRKTG